MATFSHQEKKLIATRIEQVKNKKSYKIIFKLIYENNSNYITNEKGVFINLNNINDETLFKIKEYLDELDTNKPIIPVPKEFTSDDHNKSSLWNTESDNKQISIKPFNLCLND